MGEHPARFFATDATACFLEDTSFRPLTEEELGIVEEAEKAGKDIRALTNAELEAVTKICGESYKDVDGYTGKDPRSVIRGPWEAG